jgi:hypothetical protein
MKARKENFLTEAMYLTSKQARFRDLQADSSFKKIQPIFREGLAFIQVY